MRTILIFFVVFLFFSANALAVSVAVHPVQTAGVPIHQSEVIELQRLALQACYDSGLKCSGPGKAQFQAITALPTEENHLLNIIDYAVECTLIGNLDPTSEEKQSKKPFWGTTPAYAAFDGESFVIEGVSLSCQFTNMVDGVSVYSETNEMLNLSSPLILFEPRSSNSKKISKALREMFEHSKAYLE